MWCAYRPGFSIWAALLVGARFSLPPRSLDSALSLSPSIKNRGPPSLTLSLSLSLGVFACVCVVLRARGFGLSSLEIFESPHEFRVLGLDLLDASL